MSRHLQASATGTLTVIKVGGSVLAGSAAYRRAAVFSGIGSQTRTLVN